MISQHMNTIIILNIQKMTFCRCSFEKKKNAIITGNTCNLIPFPNDSMCAVHMLSTVLLLNLCKILNANIKRALDAF